MDASRLSLNRLCLGLFEGQWLGPWLISRWIHNGLVHAYAWRVIQPDSKLRPDMTLQVGFWAKFQDQLINSIPCVEVRINNNQQKMGLHGPAWPQPTNWHIMVFGKVWKARMEFRKGLKSGYSDSGSDSEEWFIFKAKSVPKSTMSICNSSSHLTLADLLWQLIF